MSFFLPFFASAALIVNADPKKEPNTTPLLALVRVLASSEDPAVLRDVLNGMSDALQGRPHVHAPAGWSAIYRKLAASQDAVIRQKVLVLSVIFDDDGAIADLRKAIADRKTESTWREFALQVLVDKRPADLANVLAGLLDDPTLRSAALRGLGTCDSDATPSLIFTRYAKFSDVEKANAVATLAARPTYAMALLGAIEQGTIPRRDLSSFTARQLLAMKHPELTKKLTSVWGTVRNPAKDKSALLKRYKDVVNEDALQKADRQHGRQIFAKTCATCHTLFDAGAKIGPELTGSQRKNTEYILSKLLDPGAVVAQDYQLTIILTKSGRTISGIIKEESDKLLQVQTANELIRIAKEEIEERSRSSQSMMPEGLLNDRSDVDICDLLAYLAGNSQVPLPK
jgi:putative heme-binding domain-containing protein